MDCAARSGSCPINFRVRIRNDAFADAMSQETATNEQTERKLSSSARGGKARMRIYSFWALSQLLLRPLNSQSIRK